MDFFDTYQKYCGFFGVEYEILIIFASE